MRKRVQADIWYSDRLEDIRVREKIVLRLQPFIFELRVYNLFKGAKTKQNRR